MLEREGTREGARERGERGVCDMRSYSVVYNGLEDLTSSKIPSEKMRWWQRASKVVLRALRLHNLLHLHIHHGQSAIPIHTRDLQRTLMLPASRATIPPKQRGEPWFEDGNVIVLTEDTASEVTVAFKVHRGVLARHSEVFQSMFELPPPTAEDVEVADGCQVVRMYDKPTELSALIRALYDGA